MYQETIKPYAIYLNGQIHSRYRHRSDAEGVAFAMARQWPTFNIAVYWDCNGARSLLIEQGVNHSIGGNPNVSKN